MQIVHVGILIFLLWPSFVVYMLTTRVKFNDPRRVNSRAKDTITNEMIVFTFMFYALPAVVWFDEKPLDGMRLVLIPVAGLVLAILAYPVGVVRRDALNEKDRRKKEREREERERKSEERRRLQGER